MARNTIEAGENIPKHIAMIMDGNGRWAKKRLMPRSFGHKMGMERMIGLMEHAFDLGVDYVTVYALSTENLKRPKEELDGLFDLIRNHFAQYMERVCARGVRLRILGDTSLLPKDVQKILVESEEKTAAYEGKGINVALGYGARAEIVRAANLAVEKGERLTEESFSGLLRVKRCGFPTFCSIKRRMRSCILPIKCFPNFPIRTWKRRSSGTLAAYGGSEKRTNSFE